MTTRRLLLAIALAALALVLSASPADADMSGPCRASINFIDVTTADTPSTAIDVDKDGFAVLDGTSADDVTFTTIDLLFDPLPNVSAYDEPTAGKRWGGTVKLSDYAVFGSGLYEVRAKTDHCSATAWVRITGGSALTTILGAFAGSLVVLGLLFTLLQLRDLPPGPAAIRRGLGAAVILGVGGALLAQQAGLLPLTPVTMAGFVGLAISATGLVKLGLSAVRN